MTGIVNAIETHYKGYRFRSRTEARWAIFFDTLGIAYEYEKEGFELAGGVCYLPDFYLPALKMWVEIKADLQMEEKSTDKCWKLAEATKQEVMMIRGQPWPSEYFVATMRDAVKSFEDCFIEAEFGECSGCGGLCLWSYPDYWHKFGEHTCNGYSAALLVGENSPLLMRAFEAARSARFEFGETPR